MRPLGQGASLSVTIRNAAGTVIATLNRNFPANALDQESSQQFAPGVKFSGNESLTIKVTAGSAFLFGVAVDNKTNDTSFEAGRNLAFAPSADASVEYVPAVGRCPGPTARISETSFQIHDSAASAVSGRLVYHPAGQTASAGDPSIAYSLAPGQTASFANLLSAFGLTGLGTLDVVSSVGTSAARSRPGRQRSGRRGRAGTWRRKRRPARKSSRPAITRT